MAWRFVYLKRVRSTENLNHQTRRSGGDGENDEVLQFERTLGRIVANDVWMSTGHFADHGLLPASQFAQQNKCRERRHRQLHQAVQIHQSIHLFTSLHIPFSLNILLAHPLLSGDSLQCFFRRDTLTAVSHRPNPHHPGRPGEYSEANSGGAY